MLLRSPEDRGQSQSRCASLLRTPGFVYADNSRSYGAYLWLGRHGGRNKGSPNIHALIADQLHILLQFAQAAQPVPHAAAHRPRRGLALTIRLHPPHTSRPPSPTPPACATRPHPPPLVKHAFAYRVGLPQKQGLPLKLTIFKNIFSKISFEVFGQCPTLSKRIRSNLETRSTRELGFQRRTHFCIIASSRQLHPQTHIESRASPASGQVKVLKG